MRALLQLGGDIDRLRWGCVGWRAKLEVREQRKYAFGGHEGADGDWLWRSDLPW